MKNIFLIALLILLLCSGCTGNVARIDYVPPQNENAKVTQQSQIPFTVSPDGIALFQGRPYTLAYAAWAVSVDLKSIQEAAGTKVLNSISTEIQQPQKVGIKSYITNFKYKWPSLSFKTRAIVSFDLNVEASKNNQTVFSKTYEIKEFKGTDSKIFASDAHWLGWTFANNEDVRSMMVAEATLEAVLQEYEKSFPGIVETLASK